MLEPVVASSAFLIGVLIGLFMTPPKRVVAAILAFGGGILVSALSFELVIEASEKGTTAYVVGGFLLGALIYVAIAVILDRLARDHQWHGAPGGHGPRRHPGERGHRHQSAMRGAVWASCSSPRSS